MNKFEHEFLTQKESSEYLNINIRTLYNWVSQGRLDVYKMGHYNRFKKRDLDELFKLKK